MIASSNNPKLPKGFPMLSHCAFAAQPDALSAGRIKSIRFILTASVFGTLLNKSFRHVRICIKIKMRESGVACFCAMPAIPRFSVCFFSKECFPASGAVPIMELMSFYGFTCIAEQRVLLCGHGDISKPLQALGRECFAVNPTDHREGCAVLCLQGAV